MSKSTNACLYSLHACSEDGILQTYSSHNKESKKEITSLKDITKHPGLGLFIYLCDQVIPHDFTRYCFSCAVCKQIMGEIIKIKQQYALDAS